MYRALTPPELEGVLAVTGLKNAGVLRFVTISSVC